MASKQAQRIVVVGGGYGGAIAALRLAGRARGRAAVTLVDAKPHFVQRIRLHQVASGQPMAEPPYPKLLGRRVEFVQGAVERIDTDRGRVELAGPAGRSLPYDRAILATGSGADLDAVPGLAEHAHNVADAASARRLDQALRQLPQGGTVAVVGAGLTGIEAATEIAGAHPRLRVRMVSAGTIGERLSERGREYLRAALARQGVEPVEGSALAAVEAGRLALADGAEVPFDLLVWCGGFRPSELAARSGLELDEHGRAAVDRAMRSRSHPELLAAGDAAGTPAFIGGAQLRMACQTAGPAAARAADTVLAELQGRQPEPLHFGYVVQAISLGRRDALLQFTDRADRPRERILTGRPAAFYKERVNSALVPVLRLMRYAPWAIGWPFREPPEEAGEPGRPALSAR